MHYNKRGIMNLPKLSYEKANEIRKKFLDGNSQAKLSREYNVAFSTINSYIYGKKYKPKNYIDIWLVEKCISKAKSRNHGLSYEGLHSKWSSMRDRCLNELSKNYKNYGGRGIIICDEWSYFENFYYWAIENGYKKGLDIDRIDNNGNYEPSNCRFITRQENLQNNRATKLTPTRVIFIRGMSRRGVTSKELSIIYHVSVSQINRVINGQRWSNIK